MRLWRSLAAVGIMEERSTGRGYNNKPVLSVQLSWLLFTKTERWQFAPPPKLDVSFPLRRLNKFSLLPSASKRVRICQTRRKHGCWRRDGKSRKNYPLEKLQTRSPLMSARCDYLPPLSPRDKCGFAADDPVRPKPLKIRGACGLQMFLLLRATAANEQERA